MREISGRTAARAVIAGSSTAIRRPAARCGARRGAEPRVGTEPRPGPSRSGPQVRALPAPLRGGHSGRCSSAGPPSSAVWPGPPRPQSRSM